ncbi:glutathione S-transferase N-terminal domain-containing protein [Pseudomonas saliphila]|uniref:glutathione S-transferase N-terminal domain-containing protein n=1 Tax=Pseudomonas saliphila TaxID=2586906 RepID=UPI001238B3FB|nr:glutathione S-transferase N-terminal domain-containing protein [Pseudomonas saliphila]
MIMKAIRIGLGNLIVAGDLISRPSPLKRSAHAQSAVNEAAKQLALYQFKACPFCVKVRRSLHKLNVPVALHDAKNNEQDRQTLLEQGGRVKVPCLRIEEESQTIWMYESKAIIAYLEQRFATV